MTAQQRALFSRAERESERSAREQESEIARERERYKAIERERERAREEREEEERKEEERREEDVHARRKAEEDKRIEMLLRELKAVQELGREDRRILDTLFGKKFKGVKVGLIQEYDIHPKSDKFLVLKVYDVSPTSVKLRTVIIRSETKIKIGMKVAFAPIGAEILDDSGFPTTVKAETQKGLTSEGMLCSKKLLGLVDEDDQSMELPDNFPVGMYVDEAYYNYTKRFESEIDEIKRVESEKKNQSANKAKFKAKG